MKMTSSSGTANGQHAVEAILAVLVLVITLSAMRLSLFLLPEAPRPDMLTAREMRQDLYQLKAELQSHSAFLPLDELAKTEKIDNLIKALQNRYPSQIPSQVFGAEVLKLLNQLDDPGVGTEDHSQFGKVLPLELRAIDDGWLALDKSKSPVDLDYPFITHIDGIPINRWQEAAQSFLPGNSKFSHSDQGLWLKRTELLRYELGLQSSAVVKLTLKSPAGQSRALTLALAPESPVAATYGFEIKSLGDKAKLLSITDLNLLEQNPSLRKQLQLAMQSGLLVVDLRRAQGQSPALLALLSAYAEDSSPLMGFARYRASVDKRNDYLGTHAYELAPHGPTQSNLAASERFGQWFSRTQAQADTPQTKATGRLALIAGPGCRQECEWIVHNAKAWPRAMVLGEETLGDVGKQHTFRLANLKQNFFVSSSLAYTTDGSLISGAGTSPDILVPGQEVFSEKGLLALIGEGEAGSRIGESPLLSSRHQWSSAWLAKQPTSNKYQPNSGNPHTRSVLGPFTQQP